MARGDFPVEKEDFLRMTGVFLAQEGARAEVRLIASTDCMLTQEDYDNWDGGQWGWAADFEIPYQAYTLISEEDRKTLCDRIRTAMNRVLAKYDAHGISVVRITMTIPKAEPNWRDKAKRWAEGEGVTNQGRARSDNIAPMTDDGLLFRSHPEIMLYRAFKALGIAVAPLPVFIRGGAEYRRIEPDFVIIHAGITMVVEVDGDNFHHETPVTAQDRLAMLSLEGVETYRVTAAECADAVKAKACAEKILVVIQKKKSVR